MRGATVTVAVTWLCLGAGLGAVGVSADGTPLEWSVNNKYTIRDGPLGLAIPAFSGKIVMEPYRDTFFTVDNPVEGYLYRWTIGDVAFPPKSAATAGDRDGAVSVIFGRDNVWSTTVALVEEVTDDEEQTVVRSASGEIVIRYIRRELRNLFDEDREDAFFAIEEMYKLTSEEGKAKYGDEFLTSGELIATHTNFAGAMYCDHLHKGMGFLSNHVAISATFELALQTINPAIALPYWDYVYDYEEYGSYQDIFQFATTTRPDWLGPFGSVDNKLTDGRWAFVTAPRAGPDDTSNSWGLLRSQWNMNPDPAVTRIAGYFMGRAQDSLGHMSLEWPRCQYFKDFMDSYSGDWPNIGQNMENPIHGICHAVIGGATETRDDYAALDLILAAYGHADLIQIVHRSPYRAHKDLWRTGLKACPESCDTEQTNMGECMCWCTTYDPDDQESVDYYTYYALSSRMDLSGIATLPMGMKQELISYMCDSVYIAGDQMDSGSPADPSFWVLHGTAERWYQKMKTADIAGDLRDWPDAAGSYYGTFASGLNPDGTEICHGHAADDHMPFPVEINGELKMPTASQIMEALDPEQMTLPYIYDTWNWDYCAWDNNNDPNAAATKDVDAALERTAGKTWEFSKTPMVADRGAQRLDSLLETFAISHGFKDGLFRITMEARSGDNSIRWSKGSSSHEVTGGTFPPIEDIYFARSAEEDESPSYVYWTNKDSGVIERAMSDEPDLAPREMVARNLNAPGVLTGDPDTGRIHWADRLEVEEGVNKAVEASGVPVIRTKSTSASVDGSEVLLRLNGRAVGMEHDGTSLYWVEDVGTLNSCTTCDGTDTKTLLSSLVQPSYLDVDGSDMYILVSGGTSVIHYREDAATGGATVVATNTLPSTTLQYDRVNSFVWLSGDKGLVGLDLRAARKMGLPVQGVDTGSSASLEKSTAAQRAAWYRAPLSGKQTFVRVPWAAATAGAAKAGPETEFWL